MSLFKTFADAVARRYDELSKRELFVVDTQDLFTTYLLAFPEGTDPIFRVRTVHDCNADKNFLRRLGNLVALDDAGNRLTLWDNLGDLPYPYSVVAGRLADAVQQAPIVSVFRTKEAAFGSKPNWDNHDSSIRWEHFYGAVAARHKSATPDKARGDLNTIAQVMRRGLTELHPEHLDTVLDLIDAKALYRGEEHVAAIKGFRKLQNQYQMVVDKDAFIWSNLGNKNARFRNTVIGTLLVDLADGVELEQAVKKFEAKVAPENYKRPTALITPKMIEQAVAKLAELGLEEAIERRYARIEDVNVSDVLFVDNNVRGKMKGGLADLLMGSPKVKGRTINIDDAKPISIDDFMAMGAASIELYLTNAQLSNFVSLTAPQHDDTGRLFKWANDFAWMYDGEVSDSIKERVKAAGGNVTNAKLRISLAWHNSDDLDIHCWTPSGQHIYFGAKAGVLDVDMNAFGRQNSTDPVENLSWTRVEDGDYKVSINNYTKRGGTTPGFTIEVESEGRVQQFDYAGRLATGQSSEALIVTVRGGVVVNVEMPRTMTSSTKVTDKWGVKTLTPVRVDTIMLSPNFWDGAGNVGNKHWFFILEGCKNPDATRGFVNEFLRGDLDPHRKVFEVLSSKTKCPPSDAQLSGVGFSSTRNDSVIVIADGRPFKLEF